MRGLKTDEGAEEEKGDQKDKKAKDKKTEPKENSEEIIKKAELQKHCAFAIFKVGNNTVVCMNMGSLNYLFYHIQFFFCFLNPHNKLCIAPEMKTTFLHS